MSYTNPTEKEYRTLLNWQAILNEDIKSFSKNKKNINEVAALKSDLEKVQIRIHRLEVQLQIKKAQ
jgi:inorganic pyrophosphatase/exopolyphosphatase